MRLRFIGPLVLAVTMLAGPPVLADEIRVDVPAAGVSVHRGAGGRAVFSGSALQYPGLPGEPAMPYRSVRVLLPPDADLSSVKASLIGVRKAPVPGTWDVAPRPAVAAGVGAGPHWPDPSRIVAGRDVTVYRRNADVPADILRGVVPGRKRQWVLADVPVAPFQYNPVTRRLSRLTRATLTVSYTRVNAARAAGAGRADALVDGLVEEGAVNYPDMAGSYAAVSRGPAPSGDGPAYVVVTTGAVVDASAQLSSFVQSKQQRGYEVHVVTEADWGGGTGDAAAENIRAWLLANYEAMHIRYVLLVGNPDPVSGGVPMKMLWPRRNADWETSYREAPSDCYYADLTGDWDLDGDGWYGEWDHDFGPGGVDLLWDVLVGRIPFYGSVSDLDAILAKIVAYQGEPEQDIAWRRSALLAMKPSDGETPGYPLGEALRNDVLEPGLWGYHRVYDQNYGLVPAPETVPCTVGNVTNAWTSGTFGAAIWFTHGNATLAADVMDVSHAAMLDDGHPAFTFQVSCYNAFPESPGNLAFALLKNGAASAVGATRVSWYWVGQTDFAGTSSNAGMAYEYSRRLISEEMSAALALQDMREEVGIYDDTSWMNYADFNVYGCPEAGLFCHGEPADLCECDLNADGQCDMRDWLLFGQDWGRTDCLDQGVTCECDLNTDGRCDMVDWLLFGQDWGRTDCPL